ncbi:hypothetical protein LTR78_001187 [Recurvomyces mirabilis]|uniref:Triacylglycerol lipase n=1 Tax=Recurvomyces mirabilis TaxID=574656 RepID=A0AAE1C5C8_9PEZI|nr:hypothetical protein LTR78_001187 [Recurvomyces mirabilis]KAK5161163.1 hypothetical protein LTS14_000959 [Recurvomyces mirabilis]
MKSQVKILASIAVLVASATAKSDFAPLPPTQDPWYTAPRDYESTQPGSILRLRVAPGNLTAVFNASSAAYNILFRTTNSLYQPSWAVTTLLIPSHVNAAANTSAGALLSYQIPYNSPNVDASPSYVLSSPDWGGSEPLNTDIQSALRAGWYVNIPDFESHTASFSNGVTEGNTVLDSIRAVLNPGFGLDSSTTRTALWGYSGGSLASEWAAELQRSYAPDLTIAGAALGGLVSNGTSVLAHASEQWWSGLLPGFLLGLTAEYPTARSYLLSQLKQSGQYNATKFLSVMNGTVEDAFVTFANQPIFSYFVDGSVSLDDPLITDLVNNNGQMGYHGIPQMPLYIYKAVRDEITPITDTDDLVKRYCEVGVNTLYERNTNAGHLAEETNGDASAFAWLNEVLGGTYSHSGCTIRDVFLNVTNSPQ